MKLETYFVYILTNPGRTVFYVGVTNDIHRRLFEHKNFPRSSFCGKYNVFILVYHETVCDVSAAIAREKQIKAGSRMSKLKLIESMNPAFRDLADEI